MKTTTTTRTRIRAKSGTQVQNRPKIKSVTLTLAETTDIENDITDKINAIANAMRKISDLQYTIDEYTAELQPLMHSAGVTEHATKKGTAKLVTPKGRASTTIDPVEFEAVVDPEDFYAAVKVQVTKAKEVLSGRQFKSLAQVTPGVAGEEKVVVTLPKVK